MRIVITGATGNVGSALVRALLTDVDVEITGIARRLPAWSPPRVRWVSADVARDDLVPILRGADAVVHLAWLIQPSRDRVITERVNVGGSRRVFEAAVAAGVPVLVHASSVAAYSPAPPARPVDESWPTGGVQTSYYSQQKVRVERILDRVERDNPRLRVARLRPALIFQRANASQFRRLFLGPFVPGWALRKPVAQMIPDIPGLAGQILHADDVAALYRLAVRDGRASGAYNAATNPPLDPQALARLTDARAIRVPARAARAFVSATWRARLQPVSPDWLDLVLGVPVMQIGKATTELGWKPVHDSHAVGMELVEGLREATGFPTPPLEARAGGLLRLRELRTGVGGPNPEDKRSGAEPVR